eukprot:TRINITY_DN67121_c0_g1_i1.p1 TRINITY_DN67121_c0_g1~~TRINITY_DN67121_c0_g1_i1.p1  ORF type:complete len:357 (+),score=67.43 TRINITY_DN67121_c0_g1_i1:98-1072(+)
MAHSAHVQSCLASWPVEDFASSFSAGSQAHLSLRPNSESRELTSFIFGLFKKKNSGVAYDGIPRHSKPHPITASGWASRAYRASLKAQDAQREADAAMEEAARHEIIARQSADQAQAAMLQMQQEARVAAANSPQLKPFLNVCTQLADMIKLQPRRANETAVVEMRSFCAGLEDYVEKAAKSPAALAKLSGLRMYSTPPEQISSDLPWRPAVPTFRADLGGPSPVVPAKNLPVATARATAAEAAAAKATPTALPVPTATSSAAKSTDVQHIPIASASIPTAIPVVAEQKIVPPLIQFIALPQTVADSTMQHTRAVRRTSLVSFL